LPGFFYFFIHPADTHIFHRSSLDILAHSQCVGCLAGQAK
jgi:hypothetical protein